MDMAQCTNNFEALSMLSKSFVVTRLNPPHPLLGFSSVMRVVSVIINEHGIPEIGLSGRTDEDDSVEFYYFDELQFQAIPQEAPRKAG